MTDDAPITLLDDYRSGQRCPRLVGGVKKRRLWGRLVGSVDTVLLHATAVAGGFGVSNELANDIRTLINRERGPDGRPAVVGDAEVQQRARFARYRETPYHGLYSPRDRVSVVQWGAGQHTYHGNAPNSCSLGWAYDGKFTPSEHDELDIEGGRASLRHLIERALEQGCPLRRVTPHANHAPPPKYAKPHDPGPRVWLDVVVPVANEFGLDLALDWVTGGAQPWAKRWMEEAA